MRWLVALVLALTVSLGAHVVHAQTDASSDSEARALFEEGRTAFAADHFEDAARAFRRAYLLSPRFALLYNMGQAELRAGHDSRALEAFEAFLRQAPTTHPHHAEVTERVNVLRSMGVSAATTEASSPAVAVEPVVASPAVVASASSPPHDEGPGAAPWIVLGSGAAVLIAGGVLMGVGASHASSVTGATDGAHWADLRGAADDANVLWGVGIGLGVAGLAAMAVGLGWALSGSSSSTTVEATLRVGPSGLSIQGTF